MTAVHGACACGRNRYVVDLSQGSLDLAQVLFDRSNATRLSHTSPLTAFLRIPLTWYRSYTIAQYPDETARSIRRTFESPYASASMRRQFCGFCGTQLSCWTEHTPDDAEYISLTLGSVFEEDLDVLERLGLFSQEPEEESGEERGKGDVEELVRRQHLHHQQQHHQPVQELASRGTPWYETMVHESQFGRVKKQKGGRVSRDGAVKVEWEIVEYTDGDDAVGPTTPSKRKLGDRDDETAMVF